MFSTDPMELPGLFAQETVAIARSAFIKEQTGTKGLPGWAEIAAKAPVWLPAVDGYNLSYLRPGATASLIATDEYAAPLVAAAVASFSASSSPSSKAACRSFSAAFRPSLATSAE
jgi:hypothetical protein